MVVALITDVHLCDKPDAMGRHYKLAEAMLRTAMETARTYGAMALIELGDLKDQDHPPNPTTTREYARRADRILHGLGVSVYHVVGNHEVDSITKDEFLALIQRPAQVPPTASFYASDLGSWRLIVLDANFRPDGTPLTQGDIYWQDPTIPPSQLEWLRAELSRTSAPVLIAVHQRVDLDPPEPFAVQNSAEVRRILEHSGRVQLVLQGHSHQPAVRYIGGIWYYTLAALVDGDPCAPSWALLELGRRNWNIRGFGAALSLTPKLNPPNPEWSPRLSRLGNVGPIRSEPIPPSPPAPAPSIQL